MSSYVWPPQGSGGGVPIYATLADFPSGTNIGDLAVAADTQNLYVWSGSAWELEATPGAALAISAFGSTPNADGLTLSGGVLNMQPADATHPGGISTTDWNTFNNKQPAGNYITALTGDGAASGPGSAALTLATVNTDVGSYTNAAITVNGKGLVTAASNGATGNLTEATSSVLTIGSGTGAVLGSGTTIAVTQSTTSASGYLSSTDWNTFNGKQASGSYITALTGDVTASGPGAAAATLATVNSDIGEFALVTVNAKGLVTAARSITGDATTTINSSVLTLATVNVNPGTFGSASVVPLVAVNGKGLVTNIGGATVVAPAGTLSGTTLNSTVVSSSLTSVGTIGSGTWQGTKVAEGYGGTNQSTYTTGDILYASGSNTLSKLGIGSSATVLTVNTGVPSWQAVGNISVTSQTTTYSILSTDGVILCSGSAFTATLPTAASQSGETHRIIKTDSSLTNIITLATTSSQTIGSYGTSVTLNTINEAWTVVSDGTNWQVLDHYVPSFFTSSTPSGSLSTNATYSGGWKRIGDSVTVFWKVTLAGSPGTVNPITINMPSGMTINTSFVNTAGNNDAIQGTANYFHSGGTAVMLAHVYDSSSAITLKQWGGTSIGAFNNTTPSTMGNGDELSGYFTVPVSGWNG